MKVTGAEAWRKGGPEARVRKVSPYDIVVDAMSRQLGGRYSLEDGGAAFRLPVPTEA